MKWITVLFIMLLLGCKSNIPNEADVPVIIEAEILNAQGGSKYTWYEIEIKKTDESSAPEQERKIKVARLSTSMQPEINKSYILELDWYNQDEPKYGYKITKLKEQ